MNVLRLAWLLVQFLNRLCGKPSEKALSESLPATASNAPLSGKEDLE